MLSLGIQETRVPLSLPDKWIWDFWFAQDGLEYHVFYLQAPKSLGDEKLRHWHVSIGHAVSRDLMSWSVLPDAISPSRDPNAFDNYTTWTGSTIRHDGIWYLFFTGTRKQEKGLVQRIGFATSRDLVSWTKNPGNPVVEADPTWYELLGQSNWHDQAWRDPWIFRHPDTGKFHALITARVNYGPADERGVIGHAVSDDLHRWEVLPPITQPGKFGHMEVPQIVEIQNRYYLIFSASSDMYAQSYLKEMDPDPLSGSHFMIGADSLGPYKYLSERFFLGDRYGSLYSSKVIQTQRGNWVLIAFRNYAADGSFIGELSDPIPVDVAPDGQLVIHTG
jgi:beta-fructofuranosidase